MSRPGNGGARVRRQRDRERRGERHTAAHARPPEDERDPPGRVRIARPDPLRQEARDVREREHPGEPDQDHRRAHPRRRQRELARRPAVELVEHVRDLEPDEREERRVEDERQDRPEGLAVQTGLGVRELGRVPAHVEADRDRGEHRRDPERLRRQVREVRGEERDRDLRRRVVEALAHLTHDVADPQPDRDPADRVEDELRARLPERERAGDRRDDRGPVEDERARVVQEALALDHGDQAARDAEAAPDRGGGDRVGGRDDRAEHERRRPRQVVDEPVRDGGDTDHRRGDEPDREQGDGPEVRAQVAHRGEEGRRVEQRRQEAEQDDLGPELELGQTRDEREREPAQHQQDRVRNPQDGREDDEDPDAEEQPDELPQLMGVEVDHGTIRPP